MCSCMRRAPVLALLLLLTFTATASAQGGRVDIASTGELGDVVWNDGYYSYYLNTDTRSIDIYTPAGGWTFGPVVGREVSQPGGPTLVVFDFASLTIGPDVTVHVFGPQLSRPAVIAATGSVTIAGTLLVEHGRPGSDVAQAAAAGPGGGGGGAGPGYYVTIIDGGFEVQAVVFGGGGGGGGGAAPGGGGASGNAVVDKNGQLHQLAGGVGGAVVLGDGAPLQAGGGGGAGGDRPMPGGPATYGRGPGGAGGGALVITTPADVTISGLVAADGKPGGDGTLYGGSGGGGGGGGVVVLQVGGTLQVTASGQVAARGGQGGNSPAAPAATHSQGGAGGGGRIEIYAAASINAGTLSAGNGVVRTRALMPLAGHVRDLNGTGVAGVTVTLSGSGNATALTDAGGAFAFEDLVEGGAYTLTASRPGFTFDPAPLTLNALAPGAVADIVVTAGEFHRYFAEGAVTPIFDTSLALFNPTPSPSATTVTFYTGRGQTLTTTFDLEGASRVTIDPRTKGIIDDAFATEVESSQPLVVDRTMWWDARRYGGHAETSVEAPLTTWYFAEGATHSGFDLFYLLLNQADTDAEVEITYLRPEPAPPLTRTYTVAAASRANVWVDYEDAALANTDVSAVVRSTNGVPIIAERAMYLSTPTRRYLAGHESAGVASPATNWFLAEGATGPRFDLFVLLANPSDTDAEVEVRYLRPSGPVITKTYRVAARSRSNIWVDYEDAQLADTDVSMLVSSTNGVAIIVERAMWWPTGPGSWYGAHNSAGATQTGTKWALAEGEVGTVDGPIYTYVLIANTSAWPGLARVSLFYEDGTPAEVRDFPLEPNSRFNVDVGFRFPNSRGRRFSTVVESLGDTPAQLVVERAMYNAAEYMFFAAGTNALGTRLK